MTIEWNAPRYNERRDEEGWYARGSTLVLFEEALARGEATVPDPLAHALVTHLHYRHIKGTWLWVLSRQRNSVCRTPRCRPMRIEHERKAIDLTEEYDDGT